MSDIGGMLRETRESRFLSVFDAAQATHIKPVFLEALESGDYKLLPGAAYNVGFLRTYSEFLGLEPDDVLQEYNGLRPPQPEVRPAARMLANRDRRRPGSRLLLFIGALAVVLVGAYLIRQYNETNAQAFAPQLNVTPNNLGAGLAGGQYISLHLALHANQRVWVRVTVDGKQSFQGDLHRNAVRSWYGKKSIYVVTMNGKALHASLNGQKMGAVSGERGLVVDEASKQGFKRVA
ncbi:MAG: helix-turn-helix domain-containing protein [Chloroflexota bacterium]